MWSYFSRRRINDQNVQYDKNNFGFKEDSINFVKHFKIVDSLSTNIVHLLIPGALIDFNNYSKKIFYEYVTRYNTLSKEQAKKILIYNQLDRARDYHHFDIKTSEYVCDLIIKKINNFDKLSK